MQASFIWAPMGAIAQVEIRYLFYVLIALGALFLTSGKLGATENRKKVPLSEQQLADILKDYGKFQSLRVSFSQTKTFRDLPISLQSNGELQVEKSEVIIWRIQKPSPLTVRLTKKEVEIRSGTGKSEQIEKYDLTQGSLHSESNPFVQLQSWLRLDIAELTRRYEIFRMGKQILHFLPRNPDDFFRKVVIRLGNKPYLRELNLIERSGDQLRISFGDAVSFP